MVAKERAKGSVAKRLSGAGKADEASSKELLPEEFRQICHTPQWLLERL
jgi:hypothetical protein